MATDAGSPPRSDAATRGRSLRADDGRLVRGRRSRARIREAARALFREQGFDGATLRAIAARARMGASSIYRHYQSKAELLVEELDERQERAWERLRRQDHAGLQTGERVRLLLDAQHALLAEDPDLSKIALRATTHPEAPVARRVLALHERTVGLLAEVLIRGRARGDLARDADVLAAARALFHVTQGARVHWVNGQISSEACRDAIQAAADLLLRGLAPPGARSQDS